MALLCYSGDPRNPWGGFDGTGVHLAEDGRITLCGRRVVDTPMFPRTVEPLSCPECARKAGA